MKRQLALVAAVALAFGSTATDAQLFETGNDFIAACESSNPIERTRCTSYLAGFQRGAFEIQTLTNVCVINWPREGGTIGQLEDILLDHYRYRPEWRHERLDVHMTGAMQLAFPCPE